MPAGVNHGPLLHYEDQDPRVPPQNVRREFVTGVLSEEELGNKIFVYELQGEYAARVTNLRAYDAVRSPCL